MNEYHEMVMPMGIEVEEYCKCPEADSEQLEWLGLHT